MASGFNSSLTITHIGTAAAILDIDGIKLLTDPVFSPKGTTWDLGFIQLKHTGTPAITLETLPPIDGVLLSHEDHPDNLDEPGRQLLNGRHVLTTTDGANKLAPRPGVRGLKPWETVDFAVGGKEFRVTATPCQHLPGGECTGFIVEADSFGVSQDGRPNAIYVSGDTVYLEELATKIPKKWKIVVAILNFGNVQVPTDDGPLQITMDGISGARLFKEIGADRLVPMHFESWEHFTQFGDELRSVLEGEGVGSQVSWLEPGKATRIV